MPEVNTSYVYNQTQLPAWMQSSIQDILNRATGVANEPYQPYTGPTVAGFTPDQQASFEAVRRNMSGPQTTWSQIGSAFAHDAGMRNTADDINTGAAGAGSFGRATDMFGRYGSMDTAGISSPYVQQGTDYLRQSASRNALDAANPYIAQSVAPQGLAAAMPWMQMAGTSFPGSVDAYMNPYISGVTDRIAQLGARNLSENLLPALSDQFVRAGQFGSAQQRDIVGRTLRDTQESILGQQAQALERGYGLAGQLYGQDAARYAGLAGTAGGLGSAQQRAMLDAGATIGGLSSSDLARLAQAGVNIGNLGLGQAGVASADASRGIQAAQGISGIGQSQIQAAQADAARQAASREADASRMLQTGQVLGNLATGQNAMNLQNIGALGAVGDQQQAQTQANLNAAQGAFREQQQYPWQNISNLSNIIHGLPMSQSSTGMQQTTSPSPSMLSQIGGIGLGAVGLANSGIFRAKGGAVRKPRKYAMGGRVRMAQGIGGYGMAA